MHLTLNLYRVFDIEKEEKVSVLLLSFQSVFVGIFYGSFDITAHALFLEVYPSSMIPKAYVISGIVGILLTFLYSRLQTSLRFRNLAVLNLFFIAIITTVLWYGFQITDADYWAFTVFVMMGPLNIIALLGFWGTAGRLFTLRQGKRLFGLIDTGQIFGIIISTYAIPLLLDLGFKTSSLLLIAALSTGIAMFLQWFVSIKYELDKSSTAKKKNQPEVSRLSIKKLFIQPYERMMAVFVILSMVTAFFIQFSFLSVTKENYPDHTDLAKFLGYFTGSLTLFTFLFKTFVYSRLMKTYGLKTSLLISPLLLGILTVLAVIAGSFYGYTSASASFAIFFLVISLSRLFSKALKDSVEAPSFKILYQSLSEQFRHDVQAKIDGTINEMAALSSGLILAGFGLFPFIRLIHFSFFLVVIISMWVLVAFWLYRRYRNSLEKSLTGKTHESTQAVMYNIHNHHSILELLKKEDKRQENIETYDNVGFDQKDVNRTQGSGKDRVIELAKSTDPNNRLKALLLMHQHYDEAYKPSLKQLLRDQNKQVKIQTIKLIPEFKDPELAVLLIDYLTSPAVYHHAYGALIECGPMVLEELEQCFHKSETGVKDQLRIIGIYEAIGNEKAVSYLRNKLDFHDRDVFRKVLRALRNNNYQPEEHNFYQIQQLIEKHIGITGWNLAAKVSLFEDNCSKELLDALEEELTENYEVIYLLLVIAYNPRSVFHFKENLESETSEGISYALELLDLFLADELKPKLFPLFDDISLNERVRQLQFYFPIEKMEKGELLKSILNRDINHINAWTKACAIYSYLYLEDFYVTDDLIAQMFHPLPVLNETASWIIYRKNSEIFDQCLRRLDPKYQYQLQHTILESDEKPEHLLINKAFILKEIPLISKLPGYYLTKFINQVSVYDKTRFEESFSNGGEMEDSLLCIQNGKLLLYGNNALKHTFSANDIIDTVNLPSFHTCSIERDQENVFFVQIVKSAFYFIMFDYPDLFEDHVKLPDKFDQRINTTHNDKQEIHKEDFN